MAIPVRITDGDANVTAGICGLGLPEDLVVVTSLNSASVTGGVVPVSPESLTVERPLYLSLPGSVGSYASTPDSTAASITGNIDIRARITANDYTSGATQVLVAKDNGAAQRSFAFYLSNIGNLSFFYTSDGATVTGRIANSSAVLNIADFGTIWARATYVSSTGAVNFFISPNGTTWTLLGVEQTITSGSIFDSTTVVEVGTNGVGTLNPFAGRIHYVEVRNGIGGPIAYRFAPATTNVGATSYVSDTGETWTINGSATIAR